jgi:hypothetical protein
MKNYIVYHSADWDGKFCLQIARHFLGADTPAVGWNFGDAPVVVPPEVEAIYVMDLPVMGTLAPPVDLTKVLWIDHHISSIRSHDAAFAGYRLDGVAACRLAWQWFNCGDRPQGLPTAGQYLTRRLTEPLAVCWAGEYDIWDHRPGVLDFHYGLDAQEEIDWTLLFRTEYTGANYADSFRTDGEKVRVWHQRQLVRAMQNSFLMSWEGLTWLCRNSLGGSLTFAARDVPETGHDALLGFQFTGKHYVVSLNHAAHRKDLDLSEIAARYGGGGHKGAAGYTCKVLPWTLPT